MRHHLPPKPKKSVALSGVAAGNTALCTVGRTGNDLHYRGYDILDIAEQCEFEEIAYLLVHGKLPNRRELTAYKRKLKSLRGLPARGASVALEAIPAAAHPMDVMRTGVLGAGYRAARKGRSQRRRRRARHRRSPDGLVRVDAAATGITTATTARASRSRPTTTPSAAISCTCCTASSRRRSGCARCTPR